MLGTVSLLLRWRHSLGTPLERKKGTTPRGTRGWPWRGNWHLVCSMCDAHRRGLAPVTGNSPGGDRMTKTISVLTAAAFLTVCASALAQAPMTEPAPEPAPNQEMMTAPPARVPSQAPGMGEEKKADKQSKGQGKGKAKGHGKKVNKQHGLDRADEAAGQRGKHGRDKARANQ